MTNKEIMFNDSPTTYRVFINDTFKTIIIHQDLKDDKRFADIEPGHIMLYTGLRDKDNISIYERDVLRLPNNDMGEVIFARGAFYFRNFDNESEPILLSEISDDAAVIDCVYKNPALTGLF